jgi:hypothetical protein
MITPKSVKSDVSDKDVTLIEGVHEMLSEHNAKHAKKFFYSEEEVKVLCRQASLLSFHRGEFEIWWNNVKKQ